MTQIFAWCLAGYQGSLAAQSVGGIQLVWSLGDHKS
jgi:hypothetical protein